MEVDHEVTENVENETNDDYGKEYFLSWHKKLMKKVRDFCANRQDRNEPFPIRDRVLIIGVKIKKLLDILNILLGKEIFVLDYKRGGCVVAL